MRHWIRYGHVLFRCNNLLHCCLYPHFVCNERENILQCLITSQFGVICMKLKLARECIAVKQVCAVFRL